jgi:limonene-1,2-epoxide hydrolase
MVAAPPPPSPAAIVRAWSSALNANDNAAAARLFAPNARIVQGALDVRLTSPRLAVAFNASLPCAGRIVRLTVTGDRATATFVLGHRPRHTCTAARGEKAAAVFVVRAGKIVLWEQVPVPKKPGGVPA